MTGLNGLAMWQNAVPATEHDVHLIMIFVGIAAVSIAFLALVVLAGSIATMVISRKVHAMVERVEAQTTPILAKSNALIQELTPKVHAISNNVEQMTYTVRAKVEEIAVTVDAINQTVTDLNYRTKAQVGRVDGLVTEAMNTTEHVSRSVQDGIKAPIRQVTGIVAGVKTGIETFLALSPLQRKKPGPYDL